MSDIEARTLLFSYISIGLFNTTKEKRAKCLNEDLKRLHDGDNLDTIIQERDIDYNYTYPKPLPRPKKKPSARPKPIFRLKCGLCNGELGENLDCNQCELKIGSVNL